MLYLAHWIASSLMYRDPALVWITEWGIWRSSHNWHLYYNCNKATVIFDCSTKLPTIFFW